MATREENIKKINEELEKLDDEELEQVAGGHNHLWKPRLAIGEDKMPNTDTITCKKEIISFGK